MKIHRLPVGIYAANCYILIDEETKETAILDPGGESKKLIAGIKNLDVNVKYIILTHGHIDHTEAVLEVKKEFNAILCLNQKDEEIISNRGFMFGTPECCGKADINVKDGDCLELGNLNIKCIETPGHTPGGMCYLVDDTLFTGDTLFNGSIGRTDFEGGDFNDIIRSIKEKLLILPEDITVLPGHGPESTIKHEKVHNPFL